MNRHALFIIGEYRTFDWCQLWYANKLQENIDVYVSTYDTSLEFRNTETVIKDGQWDTQMIRPTLTPVNNPHNHQQTSLTHSTAGHAPAGSGVRTVRGEDRRSVR